MKLNLGAGDSPIEGYDNSFDLKHGKKAFPLDVEDASCDEIRASHILEHFGHRVTEKILQHWVSKLKPGGLIKIAVPDLEIIARKFVDGESGQFQGWIYGGHVDQNDIHGAGFSFDSLSAMMRRAGLVGVHFWPGDEDCSGLEVSLNLAAYRQPLAWPATISVISRPRLGFGDHADDALEALLPLGISRFGRTGAYWGKSLTTAIDEAMAEEPAYVLTMDYDTLFTKDDVEDLLAFMAVSDADVLIPVQMGRTDKALMNPGRTLMASDLDATYVQVRTGHFGLSLFRASAFIKLPKPWFFPTFHENGNWKYDDDINFWLKCEEIGLKAVVTPRVVVGHIEWVAMWPDRQMKKIYQPMNDYRSEGKPREVWR